MTPAAEPSRRRTRGFEAASGLLKDQVRSAGEKRGFAVARLLTHWAEIVGQDIAAIAMPVKIGYAKGGLGATLTVLTTGSSAPILQMQLPQIREKVNACYGYNAISRISVTQTAPSGFAEGQARFAPAPKPAIFDPGPVIRHEAEAVAREVRNQSLRAALEALGQNVLSRHKDK